MIKVIAVLTIISLILAVIGIASSNHTLLGIFTFCFTLGAFYLGYQGARKLRDEYILTVLVGEIPNDVVNRASENLVILKKLKEKLLKLSPGRIQKIESQGVDSRGLRGVPVESLQKTLKRHKAGMWMNYFLHPLFISCLLVSLGVCGLGGIMISNSLLQLFGTVSSLTAFIGGNQENLGKMLPYLRFIPAQAYPYLLYGGIVGLLDVLHNILPHLWGFVVFLLGCLLCTLSSSLTYLSSKGMKSVFSNKRDRGISKKRPLFALILIVMFIFWFVVWELIGFSVLSCLSIFSPFFIIGVAGVVIVGIIGGWLVYGFLKTAKFYKAFRVQFTNDIKKIASAEYANDIKKKLEIVEA